MADPTDGCSPRQRVTKSLLGYGVLAGPFYVVASVVQGLVTPGFSFARDSWSLLSLGSAGWVHVVVFVLAGLMTVAAAIGVRRHLGRSRAWTWLAVYGVLLVVAGLALPDRPGSASVHGLIHLAAGGLGFIAVVVFAILIGRRLLRDRARGLAWSGIAAAVVLLLGFVAVVVAPTASASVLLLTAGVVLTWAWLVVLSLRFYGEAAQIGRREAAEARETAPVG